MTDATPRQLTIPLAFLGRGGFVADVWADDAAGGPNAVARRTLRVTAADAIEVAMTEAGGHVVRLEPAVGAVAPRRRSGPPPARRE